MTTSSPAILSRVRGIFGVWHRDGRPVSPELLMAMRAAMPGAGPDDNEHVWRDEACGLGQPGSAPAVFDAPRLVASVSGRVDARDEIAAALDVPPIERRSLTDRSLVARALARWSDVACERLAGDWAYAAWRPDAQTLTLARDPQGTASLYVFVDDRCAAWATNLRALLALPCVPRRLDEEHLAGVLTAWPSLRSTCYAAIERLPPGCAMTVTAADTRWRRYFDLASIEPRDLPEKDLAEGLREVLTRAIADRLPDGAAAAIALSGGLDSGAVAVTAGRLRGPGAPGLAAISHVPRFTSFLEDRRADEAPLVALTAGAAGIGDVTYLDSARLSPLAGMRRALAIGGAPAHAPSNQFWLLDVLDTARARSCGILLTGQRGNITVSWSGLPGPRDWRLHWRRRDWRATAAALLPEPVGGRLRAVRRLRQPKPWREYSAIHAEFAARLRLVERMAEDGHDPTFSRASPGFDERVRVLRTARGALAETGVAFGVDVRDPTGDLRVVRYCLSIPEARFIGPEGEGRWLIRQAMADRLPPEVLWNRRRGVQSADLVWRLRDEAADVDAVLEACAAHPLASAVLDVPWLREVWARLRVEHDRAAHRDAVAILSRGIMMGIFLTESR